MTVLLAYVAPPRAADPRSSSAGVAVALAGVAALSAG